MSKNATLSNRVRVSHEDSLNVLGGLVGGLLGTVTGLLGIL